VTFRYKDYQIDGPGWYKTMTLDTNEFIRRFLMHVLPKGLHHIRHYGLLANASRAANIAKARELLAAPLLSNEPKTTKAAGTEQPCVLPRPCSCCGGRMLIIEIFAPGCEPKHRPSSTAGGQDRHIMTTRTRHDRRNTVHLCRRPPAGRAGARPSGANQRQSCTGDRRACLRVCKSLNPSSCHR
jgi:hypothetical protein